MIRRDRLRVNFTKASGLYPLPSLFAKQCLDIPMLTQNTDD